MPVYALYTLYVYAGAHAAHDLYRGGKWAVNKFRNREGADSTDTDSHQSSQQRAQAAA